MSTWGNYERNSHYTGSGRCPDCFEYKERLHQHNCAAPGRYERAKRRETEEKQRIIREAKEAKLKKIAEKRAEEKAEQIKLLETARKEAADAREEVAAARKTIANQEEIIVNLRKQVFAFYTGTGHDSNNIKNAALWSHESSYILREGGKKSRTK